MIKRKIYLIGIGMGDNGTITGCAKKHIKESFALAGAERMLEPFRGEAENTGKKIMVSYIPSDIGNFFRENLGENQCGAVLLSGDVGFSSGAKGLLQELVDFDVELVPGISSVVYFCSRLGLSWEQMCIASAHGKNINLIQRIQRHKYCFFLMNGGKSLKQLCEKLEYYHMENVTMYVGERLSYPDERIIKGCVQEIKQMEFGSLLVLVVLNEKAADWTTVSLPDSEFIRSKVPMTKQEIRAVSIGKLRITHDAVVYDVGAGTGSVSVEMALCSPDIVVYAIEKNPDALSLLEQNRQKFAADNMVIIPGTAPENMVDLPAPTHVFIGGSSGNMRSILRCVFEKNPECRVVVNIIALNSMAEIMQILEDNGDLEYDIVQLQSSYSKKAGSYQLMMANNPVYVISLWKSKK